MGANLLGQERAQSAAEGIEEGSTSGVSTVNSIKSQKTSGSVDNKYWREYREQMGSIKVENMKLLHELLESQKSFQSMLCHALDEQRAQIGVLTELCDSINRKLMKKNMG